MCETLNIDFLLLANFFFFAYCLGWQDRSEGIWIDVFNGDYSRDNVDLNKSGQPHLAFTPKPQVVNAGRYVGKAIAQNPINATVVMSVLKVAWTMFGKVVIKQIIFCCLSLRLIWMGNRSCRWDDPGLSKTSTCLSLKRWDKWLDLSRDAYELLVIWSNLNGICQILKFSLQL